MSDMQALDHAQRDRASELRLAFDRTFAQAPSLDTAAKEDLLAIRLGSSAYALRLAEVVGLFTGKKVTRVPSRAAGLLGIAGFRGTIMPVYDLETLLGYPPADSPRWLVITATAPVALAFAAFDGHLRVSREAIAPEQNTGQTRKYVRELVRTQDAVRAIVDLTSLLEMLTKQIL